MAFTTRMLINGELVGGDRTLEVKDPATQETVAVVACASEAQALAAVAAAKAAQPGWNGLGWSARAQLLLTYADAIHKRAPELAEAMVREQGKPLAEAQGEVFYAEAFVRHFAGMTLPVEVIQNDEKGRIEVTRKALGVVVGISPWNFPALVPAAKLAPALLAGNTIVLKPAPTTPICTLMLGEIAQAIFPAGVVNVVTDQNDLGSVLTSHPDVAKVTFTGSTATGRKIMASGSATLKRLTLELGGNDAAIVLDDVDVEAVAEKIYNAAFYNAGQACLAIKRVYAQESIYPALCDAIAVRASAAVIGHGLERGTQIGLFRTLRSSQRPGTTLRLARKTGKSSPAARFWKERGSSCARRWCATSRTEASWSTRSNSRRCCLLSKSATLKTALRVRIVPTTALVARSGLRTLRVHAASQRASSPGRSGSTSI